MKKFKLTNVVQKALWKSLGLAVVMIGTSLFLQTFLPLGYTTGCRPESINSMFDVTWNCGFPLAEGLLKIILILLIMRFLVNPMVAKLMGLENKLSQSASHQLEENSNDSSSWVNAFAMVAVGWVVLMTPYTVATNYLVNLLARLPHVYIWAVIFTSATVRFQLDIKTLEEYVNNFRAGHTEAAAIWTIASMFLATWLVVGMY